VPCVAAFCAATASSVACANTSSASRIASTGIVSGGEIFTVWPHAPKQPLTSSSAVRWVPDTDALAEQAASLGAPQTVITTGPADPDSEYGGIYFYGIHPVDVALRLVPGAVGDVRVEQVADTIVATAEIGGVRVVVHFVLPESDGRVPFHGLVVGRHGLAARELTLGPSYVEPGLRAFLEMAETRRPPIDYDDTPSYDDPSKFGGGTALPVR